MYQPIVPFIISLFIIIVALLPIISNTYKIDPEMSIDNETEDLWDIDTFDNINTLTVIEDGRNLRYTFGKRVKSDRLISQNTDTSNWPSPQNVTLILQYPAEGQGAVVTFVEVIVNQSSNIGVARLIAGGIGKRYIAAIVEGNRTYWFNYSASIYGI